MSTPFERNFTGLYPVKIGEMKNVVAGGTATLDLPIGPTYYELWIRAIDSSGDRITEAELVADVDDVILDLSGDYIVEAEVNDLINAVNFYEDGMVPTSGDIAGVPIKFWRPWLEEPANQEALRLGTKGEKSFQLQVKMDASVTTVDRIQVFARYSLRPEARGRHVRIRKETMAAPGSGEEIVDNKFKARPNVDLYAVHFNKSVLSDVEIRANQRPIVGPWPVELYNRLYHSIARTAQTGYTHIDLLTMNRHAEAHKQVAGDYELRLTWASDPGQYRMLIEEVHGVPLGQSNAA